MGKLLKVKITEAGKHFMKCELIKAEDASRPEGVPEPLKKGEVSGVPNTQTSNTKATKHHPLLIVSLIVLITSIILRLYYTMLSTHIIK